MGIILGFSEQRAQTINGVGRSPGYQALFQFIENSRIGHRSPGVKCVSCFSRRRWLFPYRSIHLRMLGVPECRLARQVATD